MKPLWSQFAKANGVIIRPNDKILGVDGDAKTVKSKPLGVAIGINYMKPDKILCPSSTKLCRAECLYYSGRGSFKNVQEARQYKSELFHKERPYFIASMIASVERLVRQCAKTGRKPVVRLNGTSDINWEYISILGSNIFTHFPEVQFYDYTKEWKRGDALSGKWSNYHLTFSLSDKNINDVHYVMDTYPKVNIAVLFQDKPKTYLGREVIDGNEHDLRYMDKSGVIVGLRPTGKANKSEKGFVQ